MSDLVLDVVVMHVSLPATLQKRVGDACIIGRPSRPRPSGLPGIGGSSWRIPAVRPRTARRGGIARHRSLRAARLDDGAEIAQLSVIQRHGASSAVAKLDYKVRRCSPTRRGDRSRQPAQKTRSRASLMAMWWSRWSGSAFSLGNFATNAHPTRHLFRTGVALYLARWLAVSAPDHVLASGCRWLRGGRGTCLDDD